MVERGRATLSCGLRPAGSAAGGVSCRDLWTGRPQTRNFPAGPGRWNAAWSMEFMRLHIASLASRASASYCRNTELYL